MTETKTLDVRGLSCPEPAMRAREATCPRLRQIDRPERLVHIPYQHRTYQTRSVGKQK
jgi:hypothetical protein